jgi:hypothetical protein
VNARIQNEPKRSTSRIHVWRKSNRLVSGQEQALGGNTENEGLRDTNRIMQSKTSLAMDSLLYANEACMSSTVRLHGFATEKHGPNNMDSLAEKTS